MSQIEIICTCGHKVVSRVTAAPLRTIYAGRPVYCGQHPCPACAASPFSDEKWERCTVDGLSGSAYQVAWAIDIRRTHFQQFENMIRREPLHRAQTMRDDMLALMNACTSARWWIDHQSNTFLAFVPSCPASIRSIVIRAAYQQGIYLGHRHGRRTGAS